MENRNRARPLMEHHLNGRFGNIFYGTKGSPQKNSTRKAFAEGEQIALPVHRRPR